MAIRCDRIGRKYYDYVTDYRVLVEDSCRVAEEFGIDHVAAFRTRHVRRGLRRRDYFSRGLAADIDESNALLADKSRLQN